MSGDRDLELARGSARLIVGRRQNGAEIIALVNAADKPAFFVAYATAPRARCCIDRRGGLALWVDGASFDLWDDEVDRVRELIGAEVSA